MKNQNIQLGYRISKEIKICFDNYCKINMLNPKYVIENFMKNFTQKEKNNGL